MRRRLNSTSTARIVRNDGGCPPVDGPRMTSEFQHSPRGDSRRRPQVVDNLPAVVPVTQRELDVLETYLGSLLDDMLKHTH
jgi:hypothetical protein